MLERIMKYLGIITYTSEDYSKLHESLGKRLIDEYNEKKLWQGRAEKAREIAFDVASKYNNLDKIADLLK